MVSHRYYLSRFTVAGKRELDEIIVTVEVSRIGSHLLRYSLKLKALLLFRLGELNTALSSLAADTDAKKFIEFLQLTWLAN